MSNINSVQNERLDALEEKMDDVQNERLDKIIARLVKIEDRLDDMAARLDELADYSSDQQVQNERLDAVENETKAFRQELEGGVGHQAADEAATAMARVAELEGEIQTLHSKLGNREPSSFADKADVQRLGEEVKLLRDERSPVNAAPVPAVSDEDTTPGFPRGLYAAIAETYFREELTRYSRELEAKRAAEKEA